MERVINSNRLMTAAMLCTVAGLGGIFAAEPQSRTAGSGYKRQPAWMRRDTELAREIAEHNAAVDRRRAEKRLAKSKR